MNYKVSGHETDLRDLCLRHRIHFVHKHFLSFADHADATRRGTSDQFHSDMVYIEKCVFYLSPALSAW